MWHVATGAHLCESVIKMYLFGYDILGLNMTNLCDELREVFNIGC